jgi:hypothetical protein
MSGDIPECIKNCADPQLADLAYRLGRTEGALEEARGALQSILKQVEGRQYQFAKLVADQCRYGLKRSIP